MPRRSAGKSTATKYRIVAFLLLVTAAACGTTAAGSAADAGPGDRKATTDGDVADRGTTDAETFVEIVRTLEAPPSGAVVELAARLNAGARVEVSFDTGGPLLGWDIHWHQNGEVMLHSAGMDASRETELVAETANLYGFSWSNVLNKEITVTFDVVLRLFDGAEFEELHQ